MDKYSGNVGRLVGFNGNIYIYILTQENPLLMEGFVGTSTILVITWLTIIDEFINQLIAGGPHLEYISHKWWYFVVSPHD